MNDRKRWRFTVGLGAAGLLALSALTIPRLGHATTPPPERSPFEYVGGLALHANQPQELARWYSDVLGLPMRSVFPGGVFGGFRSGTVDFHMAIVAAGSKHPGPPPGTTYLVLRVTDLDGRVRDLASHGVVPYETTQDKSGRFAMIHDPEGNTIGLWSQ